MNLQNRPKRLGLFVYLCFLAAVGFAQDDPADSEHTLEAAKSLYAQGNFPQAAERLGEVVAALQEAPESEKRTEQLMDAHLHLALSFFAMTQLDASKQSLGSLLELSMDFRLDPEEYAPGVLELLEQARRDAQLRIPLKEEKRRKPLYLIAGVAGGAGAAAIGLSGGGGANDSLTTTNSVPGTPSINLAACFQIAATQVVVGEEVRFDASCTAPPGSITQYRWDFGDGTPPVAAALASTTHAFATPGMFTVRLTVSGTDGSSNTTSRQIAVTLDGTTAVTTTAPPTTTTSSPTTSTVSSTTTTVPASTTTTVPPTSSTTSSPPTTSTVLPTVTACFDIRSSVQGSGLCRVRFDLSGACSQGDPPIRYDWIADLNAVFGPPSPVSFSSGTNPITFWETSGSPFQINGRRIDFRLTIHTGSGRSATTVRSVQFGLNTCREDNLPLRSPVPELRFTSVLTVGGQAATGRVRVDDRGVDAVSAGGRFEHSLSGYDGTHLVEATLSDASGQPGRWQFDLSHTGGLVLGSLRIEQGEALSVAPDGLVFRLGGEPGEMVRFRFRVEPSSEEK